MKSLNFFEKYLTIWIFISILVGITLGNNVSHLDIIVNKFSFGNINIPIAIGLILMIYPPLVKVRYSLTKKVIKDKKSMSLSLVLNWVLSPILMFLLAITFLRDYPGFMVGLILVGIARCIAMVLVWNDLADGNKEWGATLVAVNSVFQIFFYSGYAWFFISYLPSKMGFLGMDINISLIFVFKNVVIFLGIPLILAGMTRCFSLIFKNEKWLNEFIIPLVSPLAPLALIYTIILMFALQGRAITQTPIDIILIAIPLILYFFIMFFLSYGIGQFLRINREKNISIAFTATGNNFELALAIAIAVFGINSPQAFATVIGPLIEVPVLIFLVNVVKKLN